MKRQIYIHLGDPTISGDMPDEVLWVVQETSKPASVVYHGDLKTAANHAHGCRVVVLCSGMEVVLTHVNLPVMSRQRLQKAIPFALEEQLASDIDDLHFALGQRQGNERVNCAVVERSIIEKWLHELKEAGIQPDVVSSEVFGAPYNDGTWTLLLKSSQQGQGGKAILRMNLQAGMALDLANIVPLLGSTLEATTEDNRPQKLRILVCDESNENDATNQDINLDDISVGIDDTNTASSTSIEQPDLNSPSISQFSSEMQNTLSQLSAVCENLSINVEIELEQHSYMLSIAQYFQDNTCINLLQGDYSRKEQLEKLLRPWRPAAAVVLCWLLLQMALLVNDYRILAAKDQQQRAQIEQMFEDAFTGKKLVRGREKDQIKNELDELRKSANSSMDMFRLLAQAGEVFRDTEALSIRTLRYKDDMLDLDLEIVDLQALDELKNRLTNEANMLVEILSASSRGGKVESRMQLQSVGNEKPTVKS